MSLKQLHRLLVPSNQEAVFRSGNPSDPRIGDLLVSPEEALKAVIRCAIIGVPQSLGIERNNGRPGAERAPQEIRRALTKMATSAVRESVEAGRLAITDVGDIECSSLTLEQIHDAQHDAIATLFEEGFVPIVFGGGHDTAWPTIRAMEQRGKAYSVVNVDAHADVRELKDDTHAHSGSPFRQMLEFEGSHLVEGGFTEFGLQHHAVSKAHLDYLQSKGCHVMMLDEARRISVDVAWREILGRTASSDLYITIDTDGFSSAYAPGVSAPGADGFAPHEVGPYLRQAAREQQLVAFDVVEVSPPFDADGRTAKLAASMVMQVLAGLSDKSVAR